jgi:hypothetical protein
MPCTYPMQDAGTQNIPKPNPKPKANPCLTHNVYPKYDNQNFTVYHNTTYSRRLALL